MNIYLDIDGVLIDKHHQPVEGVLEFLKQMTDNHDCYWLTTHCRNGESNAVEYLADKLPTEALEYLNKIKLAYWDTLKTEAIDFTKEFKWYDDYTMEAEEDILKKHNCLDGLVKVENSKLIY